MADRYWVGGTGNWSDDTNHWAASSGGSPGAGNLPTPTDDVHIDSSSGLNGGGTITLDSGSFECHDFTSTVAHAYTLTDGGLGQLMAVYGSLTLSSGMTFTTYELDLDAADTGHTITTNGVTLDVTYLYPNISGGGWTLQDNLLTTGTFYHTNGTFDANGHNFTAGDFIFIADIGQAPTVVMGNGIWEATSFSSNNLLSDSASWWVWEDNGEVVTFTPNNSTIKLSYTTSSISLYDYSGGTLGAGGHTYHNLWISAASDQGFTIYGSNTFYEFKVGMNNYGYFQEGTTTTVALFTMSGNAGYTAVLNSINGVDQFFLVKASGVVSCDYLDISNSNAGGGATWYAGSHSNDTSNNTGWIFDDPAGHETADVAPVVAVFSAAAVTALFFISAIPPPVAANFSAPAVTATYVYVVTASASPVAANFSAPAVDASYIQIETASVAPTVAIFSAPAVTASHASVWSASVSPVSAHWSAPQVDANILYSTEVISPVATPPATPKFTFLVQSIDGTSFRYATENWEFDEITREVNGSMSVRIRTDQLTTDIARAITDLMNRITIRVSTANTGSEGIPYFTGFIPNRQLNLTAENQSVEIMAFGYATRLIDIPYRDDPTVAMDFTGGTKASDLSKDVIDKIREIDSTWPVNYTDTSVQDSVDTVKDIFKLSNALDVLNRAVLMASNFYWRILGDNIFTFKQSSDTADHALTYGKNVVAFPQFSEDLIQAKNEIMVVYNGGANIKRVADTDNIALYGLRSLVVNENNVPDVDTAVEIGNAYLASLLAPLRTITVTVGSNYPIEFINPGDTCRIDNLPPDIAALLTNNLFIVKTTYHRDTVDLVLSIKPLSIQNKVQRLENKFNQQVTDDLGATTFS